ncbi:MAG TPA: MoaD/ThiS family protein, partial [Candidatus Acidoferrales bacterium]|nr:MoaD/ThiS family protein [Candidatus Acidoferrales bacterium]
MRVRVLFLGMLKDVMDAADSIELPEGASVRDVLAHYESRFPRLKDVMPSLAVAVNQQYAGLNTK